MSQRHDPFGRSALPPTFSREDRVRLLREVADALIAGRAPGRAAALFVGGALDAWLRGGGGLGALERDHLRVTPPRGSHRTPAAVARAAAQADEGQRGATERRFDPKLRDQGEEPAA